MVSLPASRSGEESPEASPGSLVTDVRDNASATSLLK